MSKRPQIDLLALTTGQAFAMPEATQRMTPMPSAASEKNSSISNARTESLKTENLQGLSFRVPQAFRKRFRQRAANADMKLNELLFAALTAWEEKEGLKK